MTILQNLELLNNTKNEIKKTIESKGVIVGNSLFEEYPSKINNIKTNEFTGHADVEGLKAIGWTNEDIEYYKIYGVNWNEEYDEYHKVPQNNIDLYGKINVDNFTDYKDIIVYLPKFDTSKKTTFNNAFSKLTFLVAIPMIDTSNSTSFNEMFRSCNSLVCIPMIDTSNGVEFNEMFAYCNCLKYLPILNLKNATSAFGMLRNCYIISSFKLINTNNITDFSSFCSSCYSLVNASIDISNAKTEYDIFTDCLSLMSIDIDMINIKDYSSIGYNIRSLVYPNIKNLSTTIYLGDIIMIINKESLLYIINNSIATTNISIILSINNYNKYSVDEDILIALSNKKFVSLVKQ